MTNQISATALLQSDFPRIDEGVDRIAMAYLEARLVEFAPQGDRYKALCDELRKALLETEKGALVHLLYWFDVRADYYAHHKASSDDAPRVATLLQHFAREAHQIQQLAERARDGRTDGPSLYRSAKALHAITELHRQGLHY